MIVQRWLTWPAHPGGICKVPPLVTLMWFSMQMVLHEGIQEMRDAGSYRPLTATCTETAGYAGQDQCTLVCPAGGIGEERESACCTVRKSLYGFWVQHAARVAAVTSQLCVVVVTCCSGIIVGQLLHWLGQVVGYNYLHVTVRGLAGVGNRNRKSLYRHCICIQRNPQPIA